MIVYLRPRAGGTKFSFNFKPRSALKLLTAASILYDYYNPETHAVVEPRQFTAAIAKRPRLHLDTTELRRFRESYFGLSECASQGDPRKRV
jgi:hypothetical protein